MYVVASAYHVILTEVENDIFKHVFIFMYLCLCIHKQPTWTKHWNFNIFVIFSNIFYKVISDTLVESFLDVISLLFAVILSELHEKPRMKDLVTEKNTLKNLCE